MHYACLGGNIAVVRYLIGETNCSPNCTNNFGHTSVHLACMNGHLAVVKYLISEIGCNPELPDINGFTPLHYACLNGHIVIAKYLISDCNCDPEYITDLDIQGFLHFTVHVRMVVSKLPSISSSLNTNAILNMTMILAIHLYLQLLAMASLEPRLSIPDFSPKLRDKLRNRKPGFEASDPQIATLMISLHCMLHV